MSERKHGRRYSFKEKKDILDYLENHTYKDTSEKFQISETTLSRWRNEIKSGSKINRTKIIISLPKFWLEYLNKQIEADKWEDYSEAIVTIIRDYVRLTKHADSKYLERAKEILPSLVNLNPNIEAMLLSSSNEVIYKTERWDSTEGIQNLVENWKKIYDQWIKSTPWYKTENKRSRRIKEFEIQNNEYNIRDMSVKHIIGVKKKDVIPPPGEEQEKTKFLLGLKRKLTESDVYIFAIAKQFEESSLLSAMNTLKRAAMGSLPPISEESRDEILTTAKDTLLTDLEIKLQRRREIMDKSQESSSFSQEWDRRRAREIKKNYEWWEKEKEKLFQLKTFPVLKRAATRVNISLEPEEKKVLEALENVIGKSIERIIADPEQEISRAELMSIEGAKKLPWVRLDIDFPANKYPCHYIALNGEIILLSLMNLGLSELPLEISKLKNLKYLNLNSNYLTELPKLFSDLKSLEILILNNNEFTNVPDSIIELPRLHYLYMRNNKISNIPVSLTDTWQARVEDSNYKGSIYIPCNLIFSGNPIDRSSLTEEQIELEQKSDLNMYRHFFFVID